MVRTPEREIWAKDTRSTLRQGGDIFPDGSGDETAGSEGVAITCRRRRKSWTQRTCSTLYQFDFDKADIKPESKPIIDQIVKLLTANAGLKLTVEGHTDNVGNPAYNQRLSEARAKSVVAALTTQGIDSRRLNAVSYGQTRPIADNGTDEGRAKNRRVELVKVE
jgi:outer membrane protein OmpA-like peptidoglycan-associated protein